jgi:hypothetical protein
VYDGTLPIISKHEQPSWICAANNRHSAACPESRRGAPSSYMHARAEYKPKLFVPLALSHHRHCVIRLAWRALYIRQFYAQHRPHWQ